LNLSVLYYNRFDAVIQRNDPALLNSIRNVHTEILAFFSRFRHLSYNLFQPHEVFDVRKFVHHHTIQINQQDTTVSQVYYLTFMYGSTCFGRFSAHYQERTTALGASGSTVGG
jgi:hypothetical protein